ncbi:DUF790 family protein [Deinococcus roseus]|uniref:DUF790 family protein n=1 Tax=Deinococcus roseus TaxID=392414 RepID=A0ABQ2CW81_9DEIO|nr:DUF790 family protein [Deinococcus roseus]GGJ26908.1 hypothetical protein GCM10008938_11290 [Deinococcus roseus]
MLTSDLLQYSLKDGQVRPKLLKITLKNIELAREIIEIFEQHVGLTRRDLSEALQTLEGESTDYRTKRGLAHLLSTEHSTFDPITPLEPIQLRERVFLHAAKMGPIDTHSQQTLTDLAMLLGQELGLVLTPEQIREGLYADLPERHYLTSFEAPVPEDLLDRFNTAQAQGIFYRAYDLKLTAFRNSQAEYKYLFKFLKLFGLMTYIEGDQDTGFTITVDGPTSLFSASTRYGLSMAKLLPALLHVSKWNLTASLKPRSLDLMSGDETLSYTLDSQCGLRSHYKKGQIFDSALEESFAGKWAKAKTEWVLEKEVDLLPIPGSVMIPDFRITHPNGKSYVLEVIGYWRPEYLRRKFQQLRKVDCDNMIIAVSDRLNLGDAGVDMKDLPVKVVFFKGSLQPKAVLELLEV